MTPVARLATAAVLAVLTALGLGACGSDSTTPEEAVPEHAITVQQNVPTPVEGGELVAYNLSEDSAWVSIVSSGQEARKQQVQVGDLVTVGEVDYTVHSITPGTGDSAAPGAGSGRLVVVPADR